MLLFRVYLFYHPSLNRVHFLSIRPNVTTGHNISVVYAIDTNTIDTTVTNGTITPDATVDYGSNQTITYSADANYHLVSVTVDGNDVTATNPSSYTFTNVTTGHNISVVYEIDTKVIDTTVTNGTITPDATVDYGSNQTVSYSANPNYHLVSVTVDGNDVTATNPSSYTFTNVTTGHTISVVYAIDNFTLSYTTDGNGTISGTASQTVNYGSDGTSVTAVANTGYHFVNWSDGVTTASRTDTNVIADKAVQANFAIDTHTLSYTTDGNGTISGTASQTVNYGSDGTSVTAVANTGYRSEERRVGKECRSRWSPYH